MFIDMSNSLNEYLQDMLVSESLAGASYTSGIVPEWVVLDTPVTFEVVLETRVR